MISSTINTNRDRRIADAQANNSYHTTVVRVRMRVTLFAMATGILALASTAFAADLGSMRKIQQERGLNEAVRSGDRANGMAAEASANTNPQGGPYGVLGANWWQWVFSLPVHDVQNNIAHPQLTAGAVDCSIGQSGSVWFLAGNFTGGSTSRSCTIPQHTSLFFPLLNSWCDNTGFHDPGDLTLTQLKACAAFFSDPASLHASVDGVGVPLSASNRGLAAFQYTLPNTDNLLQFFGAQVPGPGWPSGNTPVGTKVAPAISDGSWLLVSALPPGVHTINFGGTAVNGGFSIDITYRLTVN